MGTVQICIYVLLLAAVVHCSIHDLSSHHHLPLVHAQRHDDDDIASDRDTNPLPLSPGSHCLFENFHYPHHCKVPDCDFMVAWREDGDTIRFNLTAKVTDTTMVWAAIGFSEDTRMRGSDGVICYMKEDRESEVHLGVIQPQLRRTVKIIDELKDALSSPSVQVEDNKLYCSFSRKKNIDDDDALKWKSLSQSWHILVATGKLDKDVESNTTKMLHHIKKAASNCKCNVSLCMERCDCPDGIRYQLLKLHGVLMSVAFIFFIPTGALLSRYYKMVFSSSWFKGHVAMMVIGILWALIGFGMILGHTGGVFSIGIHQLAGITCLSLVVIQPVVGFLRPPVERTIRRVLFVAFHKSVAIFILVTSCVALFMGTYIFCNPVMTWIMAIIGLSILTNLGFILLLEILTRTHKFYTAPPVGYHKVTKNDDLSESEEEVFVRDDPNKKTKGGSGGKGRSSQQGFNMEKTLLVIYVLQAFGFAVLVAALLYYFDSHKHGD